MNVFVVLFLVFLFFMICLVIVGVWFTNKFMGMLGGGSVVLPPDTYQGYVFGANKINRQNTFGRYFLTKQYEKESRPELRYWGNVGRWLWIMSISMGAIILLAFLAIILSALL